MKTFQTNQLPSAISVAESLWIYNGLDCCLTSEIWEVLHEQLKARPAAQRFYRFEFGMQGPALAMTKRGLLVDKAERDRLLLELESRQEKLQKVLDTLATAVWGRPLNPNSPAQLKSFFYGVMKLPEQKRYDKVRREAVVSTDKAAIEKLQLYFDARPIATTILALRRVGDTVSVLRTGIDPDGRLRCSYNVTGTETGRWSSSKSVFDNGSNLQNITDRLRRIVIAEPGKKLGQTDLAQAESRFVAYLSGDQNYIQACESGDLHTTCCRMIWPNLPWTGDLKKDKKIAETPFYNQLSYRDMSKRAGHGSNYYGTPHAIAHEIKVGKRLVEEFQELYFDRFPGIRRWQRDIITKVQQERRLISPLGRERQFFGRPDAPETWRQAIASVPQGCIGDILNVSLYRCWTAGVEILGQVHDSILFQFPEGEEEYWCKVVLAAMQVPFTIGGQLRIIPSEVVVGWNWSADKERKGDNPHGLVEWSAEKPDTRTAPDRRTTAMPLLDRVLCQRY